ncbi:MAG: hypothetical protein LBT55_00960 [Clostridiaceae bacterium]|jgi:UDP-N-acetylglucosamine:LPS N-acetylglucosamine transferase|nr:hypothetical protein [Clostridiaceae bacterium]
MKKNILLLTSSDVDEEFVNALKDSFKPLKEVRLTVLTEEQYGGNATTRIKTALRHAAVRLPHRRTVAPKPKNRRVKSSESAAELPAGETKKSLNKKLRRIRNAILRFEPERIVVLSPYAMGLAHKAKKKSGFKTEIFGTACAFTHDNTFFDLAADGYTVQNVEQKNKMTELGFKPDRVFIAGFPLAAKEYTSDAVAEIKGRYCRLDKPTVLLNGGLGSSEIKDVYAMLSEQGGIINLLTRPGANNKITAEIRKNAEDKGLTHVVVINKNDSLDECLAVADIVVTVYDAAVIYKALLLKKRVIVFGARNALQEGDFKFLASKGLVQYAESYADTVISMYKLFEDGLESAAFETDLDLFINKEPLAEVTSLISRLSGGEEVQ